MRLTKFIPMLILVSVQMFGQSIHKVPMRESGPAKSYPIDAMPFLQKQYQQAVEYMRTHPDNTQKPRLRKSAWSFTVGSTKSWWVYNVALGNYYLDASTCRQVGTHCYVFVEDSIWATRVTQAAVDSIENDFDNKTPANPSKGIYDTDVSAFGTPPDVDSDPKIIILICNIQDGYNGTGGYIAGFFDPWQETTGSQSNHAEIYYVDANPTDLTSPDGIETAMSTAAHEFQHMINWNYHKTVGELTFVNEGCSMLAEINCGYPPANLSLYANETNHYLFDWRTNDNTLVLNDYARAQRFSLYLWDRYGIGIFKYIVSSLKSDGISIINDALTKYGISSTFNNVFSNWLIANQLNDTTSNRLYGYAYPNLPKSNGKNFYNPNVFGTDSVQNIGAQYLLFKGGSNLSVIFSNPSSSPNISVQAIEVGSSSKNVVPVSFGSPFSEPNFGSTYGTVAFAVINSDPNNSIVYTYQASGTAQTSVTELKWDNTEPVGYFKWDPLDTLCVTFDACPGGTLDSIRVALRRAGSIVGGIYQSTGVSRPSPLGKLLARDTATIGTTSSVPYAQPFANWTTVDLSAHNISTDQAFAVAFIAGPVDTIPGVMVTDISGTNPYHSFTYLNAVEAGGTAGWYYIGDNTTSTISIYLIRAYMRFTTGITKEIAPMPMQFSLGQNYPNPFNPSTVIGYQLSNASQVTLSVYDILGRQVAVLVNKRQEPGHHSLNFDASALPSGVFFYRLTTDGNIAVKKMVFIK